MLKKLFLLSTLLLGLQTVQAQKPQNRNAAKAEETVVEIGKDEGFMTNDLPLNFSFQTSVALSLYSPEDLNAMKGNINAVAFDGKFGQEITVAMQVYIGETDEKKIPIDREAFEARYIDVTTLTKVFDGDMTFPEGDHQEVRFDFTEPFAYSGERTLAVYTFARIDGETVDYTVNQFYASDYMGQPSMSIADVGMPSAPIDPMDPNASTSGYDYTERANTKFFFASVSEEKYNLNFTVKDAAGQALSGAVITLNGKKQEAGKYAFEDMPLSMYDYIVEKDGFVPGKGRLRLSKDTTVDVALTNMADYPGLSGFVFEDFDNIAQGKRPLNWTGDFYVDEKGGKDDGHRFTHSFWFMDGPRYILTNPIFMDTLPVFTLEYRVMEMDEETQLYTGNAFAGKNMSWQIEVSENFGETWKILYLEEYGTHTPSKDYKPFSVDVSSYTGKICLFKITVNRDSKEEGDFLFDIDNLKIGTQLANDLAVASKIEGIRVGGVGSKDTYTVYVRNQGTETAENYSLKFYDGQTEIGSVPGTKLESGKCAKLTYEYTFAKEGEHTLTARCMMEDDNLTLNNTTPEFYVSVQAEGIQGSMVDAYEGEDMLWAAPLDMYAKYSLSWILYKKDDLKFEAGNTVSGMAFRTKFDQPTDRMRLSVYIGETDNGRVLDGVPAPASLTKVFEGAVTVGDLDGGNFIINFDRTYRYTGKNLVVAFYKESTEPYNSDLDFGFYGCDISDFSLATVMSIRNADPIDLSKTLTEEELYKSAKFCNPSTTFLLNNNVSYYTVNFEVTDQNGQPVKNATVTFNGQTLKTGVYKVEDVADGTYAYSVSLGEETVEGSVTVNGADVTEKVQFQHVANENILTETMVRIYPNPTTDKLHIDVAEGAKEINLYDISGRTVRKLNRVPAGVIEMDLSDCHSGIYLLMIDGKAFKISKR